ncbi:Probable flavin-containing monooxygenase 1 [Linum perenne]
MNLSKAEYKKSSTMAEAENNRIAIIGAGMSGLLACKYALSKNLHPTVFESRNDVGGVWTKTLSTTKLQTPKSNFQFSDFPWPDSSDEIPTHDQVLDYLKSYADHFDLNRYIQLSTRVVGIRYSGVQGKWEVEVSRNGSLETEVYEVGFVILCVGRYSDVPYIPEFKSGEGPEVFKGRVMHSMEYSDLGSEESTELVKGKRVAVVGFQKSALDIAMECSAVNVTVCSSPKPNSLINLVVDHCKQRWIVSKIVERDIKQKHQLTKHGMVPKQSFLQDSHSCLVSIVPDKFYDMVDQGSIKLVKAPSFSFCEEGIVVGDHNKSIVMETNLVILATGFKGETKLRDVFGSERFRDFIVGSSNDVVPLYRNCIPPRIPQLAVLGFTENSSNLFTTEMKCRWLAELLDGKFKLPEIKEMEEEALKWDMHFKEYSGDNYKRSCVDLVHIWYNDQLCKDMGWNPRRKTGLWAELFEPYGPLDYLSP